MKYLLVVFFLAVMTSCGSTVSTKHSLTDCEHPSGWCKEIRETAQSSFIFAQIAANTYEPTPLFTLPNQYSLIEFKDNDPIGFAYSIYENKNTNTVIISFRGTENMKDWWYGNILASQNKSGLNLFDKLREKYSDDTNFIVTGHSLGGAIALEVSLKRSNVDAYVFNTSPRFSSKGYNISNKRVSIVEYGEALKILRAPSIEASQKYTSIGCSSGWPISQHEQSKLAACLTQIAAIHSDLAKESLKNNNLEFKYK
ncbi:MAG: hypothetical protein ABJH28_15900 [Paraglaciecola sp.]|uniref:lipase family protein n=1 Tax=Paraglaciecola sp. TaxID=1920173 RepID=UPI0032658216